MKLEKEDKKKITIVSGLVILMIFSVAVGYYTGGYKRDFVQLYEDKPVYITTPEDKNLTGPFEKITNAQFHDVVVLDMHKVHHRVADVSLLSNGWKADCYFFCNNGIHYTTVTHNLVTNVGITYVQHQIFGSANPSASAIYIALTTDTATPAYTDTTCPTEITTNGLQRAAGTLTLGTPAAGTSVNTLVKTFTASGSFTAIAKGCLFTASVGGTLFADTLLPSTVNLAASDTLVITWTVTITY